MGFTGSLSGGEVVKVIFKTEGDDVVVKKIKNVQNHLGQMGTATAKYNTQGTYLSHTWEKQQSALGGLATRFVGLQAAVRYAEQAIRYITETIRESITKFREFEYQMAEVSTILDITMIHKSFQYSKAIESMSVRFGKSVEDLSSGMYDILSAAVDVEQAVELLSISSKAAIAGLSTVEQAVDALTSVLNSYGLTVVQMYEISDIMFQSVVRGKFTFEDLASAIGYVIPIAAQVGVEFKEVAAAFATATRYGLRLDMTSRGLALMLQNIINPGEQARKTAEKYGLTLSEAQLQAKGLEGFMKDLNEATNGNAAVISQIIPNMRSYRVAMVLAGKGLQDFTDDVELMNQSLGMTEEAFMKVANTSKMYGNILQQTMEQLKRDIGAATDEFGFLYDKLGMFGGAVIKNLFGGLPERPTTSPLSFIFHAVEETVERVGTADKVMDAYRKKFREKIEKMYEETEGPDKSLFEQFKEGAEIDVSGYKDMADNMDELDEKMKNATIAYSDMQFSANKNVHVIAMLGLEIDNLTDEITELEERSAPFRAFFDDLVYNIQKSETVISSLSFEMQGLVEDIGKVGDMYDGKLGKQLLVMEADKRHADINHWVGLTMKDSSFLAEMLEQNFSWLDETMVGHITTVANYKKAEEALNQILKENSNEIRKNSLAIMEIQLKGMMRRRGLTRKEEREIHKLQISNMKLRINSEKESLKNMTHDQENAYENAKDILDRWLLHESHVLWKVKDNRQEEIDDLKASILTKEQTYLESEELLEEHYLNMQTYVEGYAKYTEDVYGRRIPEAVKKQLLAMRAGLVDYARMLGSFGIRVNVPSLSDFTYLHPAFDKLRGQAMSGRQRGSYYVPETRPYLLHRGEQVVPSGRTEHTGGGNVTIEPITINMNVYDATDTAKLAQKIQIAIQQGLISGVTTKYR